jgi:anti-anti-sigma factor
MGKLEIRQHQEGEVAVLALLGELGSAGAKELDQKIESLLQEGHRYFVFDFTAVEHVGSAGLRSLVMLDKKLGAGGGRMALCGVVRDVREAFDLAGLTRMFTLKRTKEDALGSLPVASKAARITDLARKIFIAGGSRSVAVPYRGLDLDERIELARGILYGSPTRREGARMESADRPDDQGVLGKATGWLKRRRRRDRE